MAVEALRVQPDSKSDGFWIAFAIVVGLGLWLTTAIIDRARLDPEEAFAALTAHDFSQDLPEGIAINSKTSRPRAGDDGVLGSVSFVDARSENGAHGGAVVLTYEVHSSAAKAQNSLMEHMRGLESVVSPSGRTFSLGVISERHRCANDLVTEYCIAGIGPVLIQANSRLALFDDADSEIEPLMRAAIDHLRQVIGGI